MNLAIQNILPLIEFIANFYGETTEVVIGEFVDDKLILIKASNQDFTTQKIGEDISDLPQNFEHNSYSIISKKNKKYKCAAYHIKDTEKNIVGILYFIVRIDQIMQAVKILENNFSNFYSPPENNQKIPFSNIKLSMAEIIETSIQKVLSTYKISVDKLSVSEKREIVSELDKSGVFQLKGSITKVAMALRISEPTIYRYLSK